MRTSPRMSPALSGLLNDVVYKEEAVEMSLEEASLLQEEIKEEIAPENKEETKPAEDNKEANPSEADEEDLDNVNKDDKE